MSNKKIKSLLGIFFFLNAMLIGMYGYLLYAVQDKNQETTVLYSTSHQQASDKEKIKELERTLKETEKDRIKLSEHFITKANAVSFIEQIEKVGRSAEVNLSVNSVSDDVKNNTGIQLSFSALGSFSDIYRLIALVEAMPYKISLKKTALQRVGNPKEIGAAWKGDFTLAVENFTSAAVAAPQEDASAEKEKP